MRSLTKRLDGVALSTLANKSLSVLEDTTGLIESILKVLLDPDQFVELSVESKLSLLKMLMDREAKMGSQINSLLEMAARLKILETGELYQNGDIIKGTVSTPVVSEKVQMALDSIQREMLSRGSNRV